MSEPPLAAFLAPIFLAFEVGQLVAAEKLLGVKQIEAGADPRRNGGPGEFAAGLWASMIVAEGLWLLWLLAHGPTRVHAACLLLVTLVGFTLRSNCTLRWVLVILTIEGALRMGLIVSMLGSAWRAL
jgi:hypothetical protein